MSKHDFVPDRTQPMREQVTAYIKSLQKYICAALESVENSDKKFFADAYTRAAGAGFGISSTLAGGQRIEKAGVGVSVVTGALSPAAIKQMRANHAEIPSNLSDSQSLPFLAAGLSLIVHPRNPMAPTVHLNYRYFELVESVSTAIEDNVPKANGPPLAWWFGGGCDLTPSYVFDEDAIHFHETIKAACDKHSTDFYRSFKPWCDEYFFIPHRNEGRGLGGIFFDDLSALPHTRLQEANGVGKRPTTPEALFDFIRDCGDAFVPSYVPILQRRVDLPYTDEERRWQLIRRGRYVEFNLMYDRGTKFGLSAPGARIESILMSLPETARWEYCTDMGAEGTREGELVELLRKPKDWIPLTGA